MAQHQHFPGIATTQSAAATAARVPEQVDRVVEQFSKIRRLEWTTVGAIEGVMRIMLHDQEQSSAERPRAMLVTD